MRENRPGDILTLEELSSYLKIPKSTIYKLVREGKIPAQKIAGRHLISGDDLPFIIGRKLTTEEENRIETVVKRAVTEYGRVFKWLSRE